MKMKPLDISDASFERDVIQSTGLTIVDFWAPWCGPCKMIAPILDEIASRYAGQVKIAKLNVDENAATPREFGITSIPTLLFFNSGAVVDRISGAVPRGQIEARISRLLHSASEVSLS